MESLRQDKTGIEALREVAARPLRLLIVAPSFDILGGQSVQAARLLSRLQEQRDLDVGFLPINPRLPGILRKLQSIKYVRTLVTSIAYLVSLFAQVPKYDVLHVFSASYLSFVIAPTPAILVGRLFRKKVLLNYHSGEAEDHLKRWRSSAIPTIKMVDALVVPSEYLVRVFAKFDLPARAIYNLIDTRKFRFRERMPLRPVFLSNRSLETHYGVDRVIKAFAIIQKEIPEAGLTVAGAGSQRNALEGLAASLNLQHTRFVGQVPPDTITEQYDDADIYLNGSEIDNQPLSLLEAFACGLPIVTTDAGGIPYIVTNEQTGFVVPRGDYQKLADCALRLLREPQIAKAFSERGLEECRKYSWAVVKDSWLGVYHELHHTPTNLAALAEHKPDEKSKVLTR